MPFVATAIFAHWTSPEKRTHAGHAASHPAALLAATPAISLVCAPRPFATSAGASPRGQQPPEPTGPPASRSPRHLARRLPGSLGIPRPQRGPPSAPAIPATPDPPLDPARGRSGAARAAASALAVAAPGAARSRGRCGRGSRPMRPSLRRIRPWPRPICPWLRPTRPWWRPFPPMMAARDAPEAAPDRPWPHPMRAWLRRICPQPRLMLPVVGPNPPLATTLHRPVAGPDPPRSHGRCVPARPRGARLRGGSRRGSATATASSAPGHRSRPGRSPRSLAETAPTSRRSRHCRLSGPPRARPAQTSAPSHAFAHALALARETGTGPGGFVDSPPVLPLYFGRVKGKDV